MPGRTWKRVLALLATTAAAFGAPLVGTAAGAAGASRISGSVFDDANRNGTREAGEAPFANRELWVATMTGETAGHVITDADGHFELSGLADGEYRVWMAATDWESLRNDWVPTTGLSLRYERYVTVAGTATADLGLRRIVRSTVDGAPITAVTGADGLRVESYNDAITAQQIYDELHTASLLGGERAVTRVRFDLGDTNVTHSKWSGVEGAYTSYAATIDSDYLTWLSVGNKSLFHEYGHAWSMYHALMVQQTENLDSYLSARGLLGDPRVGSNVYWDPQEMIAEDFRQLFGSGAALTFGQANTEIPRAADVVGLREWLRDTFTAARAADQPPAENSPAPAPTPASFELRDIVMSPDPVSTSGTVGFTVSDDASVTVEILDSSGVSVRTVVRDAHQRAGSGTAIWDRKNDAGRKVRAGDYSVRITAASASGGSITGTASFKVVDLTKGRK